MYNPHYSTHQLLQILQELRSYDFVKHHGIVLKTVDQTTESLTDTLDALFVLIGQSARQEHETVSDQMKIVGIQILTAIRCDCQSCALSRYVEEIDEL